jgi:hypothetical protein
VSITPKGPRRAAVHWLFRGFEELGRAGTELFEQRRLVGLGCGEMLLLNVTEAANFFRNNGEADCKMMIFRRQILCRLAKRARTSIASKPPPLSP